eukprot:GHVN01018977.1.p3 GENE.GHVN01018977.1~~GHVN01018977.1.p3  ORF type:complete len:151 (+),score=36.40 GHVN01018977.1:762-1214(+)
MAMLVQSKSITKQIATPSVVEEESGDVNEIDKLQAHGINVADINKLKTAGLCTVLSVLQSTKKELCNVKGLSEAKVEKLLEAAAKIELVNKFVSGNELLKKRANVLKLTTGSTEFDKMLGGGIESLSITELFGENRTGLFDKNTFKVHVL